MSDAREAMLEVLRGNRGFARPERWLDYAIGHGFRSVEASVLEECPDCGCSSGAALGQYVHYSTLVRLVECRSCSLLYSDTRIDPQIIHSHFETSYKSEQYFLGQRRRVFKQIAALVDRHTPPAGAVLDIGGAKGHLLASIRQARPDLRLVLHDLSREACDYAAAFYGLETVQGGIGALEAVSQRFHTVVMSDVLYYEPELRRLWRLLPRILAPGGTLILRLPNKELLIRLSQFLKSLVSSAEKRELQDRIGFFNPEHIYLFTRRYLTARLHGLGCARLRVVPSELSLGQRWGWAGAAYLFAAKLVALASGGGLVVTPSLLVLGKLQPPAGHAS